MAKTYRDLLIALKELERQTPEALDFSITIKIEDEYHSVDSNFIHFDDENPSGEGIIEDGTPILEVV